MRIIEIKNEFYNYKMRIGDDNKLSHISFLPTEYDKLFEAKQLENKFNPNPFEFVIDVNNEGICNPHGTRNVFTFCSRRSVVRDVKTVEIFGGNDTVITVVDEKTGLNIELHYECFDNSPAIRRYAVLENRGKEKIDISLLTSFTLSNLPYFNDDDTSMFLHCFRSSWCNEGHHYRYSFPEIELHSHIGSAAFSVEGTGTWVCNDYIPMFVVEQKNAGIFTAVQIENSSSWRFELGGAEICCDNYFYMHGGIGNELRSGWKKELAVGERFVTPKASLAVAVDSCEAVLNAMHLHRSRALIKRSRGDRGIPVIYNDWMYIEGKNDEKTITEQLDILEHCGMEVCVTDAGWFCEPDITTPRGTIWNMTGHYEYDKKRFPNGIKAVADQIKAHNMRAGIWCEIECVGDESEFFNDKEMLLCIGDTPVTDSYHRFLNFTSPKVIRYANKIFDRFVEWGFEYVKIDYNADSAPGADNCGDKNLVQGLYNNRKAYDRWLDDVRKRHPQLIIESCSSGGMRLEYNSLIHADMSSITDQNDFKVLGTMLYNVTKAIHPSQCGVWAYTQKVETDNEFDFAIANTLLGRPHFSGDFENMNDNRKQSLVDAVALYKKYRHILNDCFTYHHSGYHYYYKNNEKILCMELRSTTDTETVVMLERTECKDDSYNLKLSGLKTGDYEIEFFPKAEPVVISSDELKKGMEIKLPNNYNAKILYVHRRDA